MKDWIARVKDLAHRYECWAKNIDRIEVGNLRRVYDLEMKKRLPIIGTIEMKLDLAETVMREHEDMSRAMYEYVSMLERCKNLKIRMIPHKHDFEIVDYVMCGERNQEYEQLLKSCERRIRIVKSEPLNDFEYSLQFRLKIDGEGWDMCNFSKGRPLDELRKLIVQQRKDYPQYEWRIVMREVSDWFHPEGV